MSTDVYLQGLLSNDREVVQLIYREFAPKIESVIIGLGGSRQDARDVFQDALIIIWRNANQPEFKLTSSFYSYLHGICRYVWLRKRKKKDNNTVTMKELKELKSEYDIHHDMEAIARRRLFHYHLRRIGQNCRRLLQMFFEGRSMREIGDALSIATEHATRNRKYRCQKKLEENILSDPTYQELRTD